MRGRRQEEERGMEKEGYGSSCLFSMNGRLEQAHLGFRHIQIKSIWKTEDKKFSAFHSSLESFQGSKKTFKASFRLFLLQSSLFHNSILATHSQLQHNGFFLLTASTDSLLSHLPVPYPSSILLYVHNLPGCFCEHVIKTYVNNLAGS